MLQAPPGSGKTTLVPLALLASDWLGGQKILMLEPRRLAARAAAARLAELCAEPVGATVGYRVRFDSKVSAQTRIEVITEGVLTRLLQTDPGLSGVGLVIFDEFHERSLQADLGLALCLDVRAGLRDDLRLLLMSATLDGEAAATLLGDAPLLCSESRSYPVELRYLPRDPDANKSLAQTITQVLSSLLDERPGDVLVFLPGVGEIRQTQRLLNDLLANTSVASLVNTAIVPLYGDLPLQQQRAAILPDPDGRRRVILATPIAETSLTIEGVQTVIDSGWARLPRFSPRTGLTRLALTRVSKDAAEQRAGRAGRLGPGVCLRLWSEATQRRLIARRPAEILDADLAPLLLELAQWGVNDPTALCWLDNPPPGALAQAGECLRQLGAFDHHQRLTTFGRKLTELPLQPRLAALLLTGIRFGAADLAADLCALLEQRDVLTHSRDSDIQLRLTALQAFRAGRTSYGDANTDFDPSRCAQAEQLARRWRRRSSGVSKPAERTTVSAGLLLAVAYPDRIAQRRSGDPQRYRLANGRGVRLLADDSLCGRDWLVAAHLDGGDKEGRIFLAAAIDPVELEQHQLFAAQIEEQRMVIWDNREQAVVCRQERRFGALVLAQKPIKAESAEMAKAMLEGVRQLGLEALPWDESSRQLQARVACLRRWLPEQSWPALDDQQLAADLGWLEPYLADTSRRAHLQRLDLTAILHNQLDWSQRQQLEQLAPKRLTAPSGSQIALRYDASGQPPVLAVKVQELFGLAATPTVAGGRMMVLLHLLSPARRPIQVTQDLAGFWQNTYPEVKKELQGRYPKHPWPVDPWTAVPTATAKARRRG